MMMGYGIGGFAWPLMLLLWVAIIGLVIWAIASLFPRTTHTGPADSHRGAAPQESAMDILKRRYAQGEISQAEFDEMRRILET